MHGNRLATRFSRPQLASKVGPRKAKEGKEIKKGKRGGRMDTPIFETWLRPWHSV